MLALPVTALYAGVLALVLIFLAFSTGAARTKAGVSVGDGGDTALLVAIRRHGNAVEWVPMALILLGLIEANGAPAGLLHGLGGALVLARIAHPLGLHHQPMSHPLRLAGAGTTTLVMLIAAGYAIWQTVRTLI
ncbi:MAG: MAPEG family protein [Pseudomonadota bacterium]